MRPVWDRADCVKAYSHSVVDIITSHGSLEILRLRVRARRSLGARRMRPSAIRAIRYSVLVKGVMCSVSIQGTCATFDACAESSQQNSEEPNDSV